jgi:prevent-host-death family protein
MPIIKPVSDLRNNFAEISRLVHEEGEPVYLTKNGYGDMVVMSISEYQKMLIHSEITYKLREAEIEAQITTKRFTHHEVIEQIKKHIDEK